MMIDCGLFQGPREWKDCNWKPFPIEPSSVHCILLTHAHIDHAGILPRFMKAGFHGPVFCTPATAELLGLMVPDSGHLQEEDAEWANKKRYTKHDPALPLYTEQDAKDSLELLKPIDFYTPHKLAPGLNFTFLRAGHILGSAMIQFQSANETVVFTGDLGRPSQFITKRPDDIKATDYMILESTYGNRLHQRIDVKQHIADIIRRTVASGGSVLVPAFAVGRTQELLYILRLLQENHEIPALPIFIDSPMAIHAIPIYDRYREDDSQDLEQLYVKDNTPFLYDQIKPLQTVAESMTLNNITYPSIIVSSSGMATGGRILHHLKHKISDHRNTVLFIGFQSEGTKGRYLVDGVKEIKIHGKTYPVRARIEYMDALSCHADYEEVLQWLTSLTAPPRRIFLTHGEESASLSMADKIKNRFAWNTHVPHYLESVELI